MIGDIIIILVLTFNPVNLYLLNPFGLILYNFYRIIVAN